MTNEIKFRAWDGWYGNFAMLYSDKFNSLEEFFTYSQRFERLMQYTGLKDRHGKEIYEGDIVSVHQFLDCGYGEDENMFNGIVEITPLGIEFITDMENEDSSFYCMLYGIHEESLEIIGNIFENPEKLKDERGYCKSKQSIYIE